MTELSRWIVNYCVNSVWQVPLFLLAATIATRGVRRMGCGAQHAVWVAALALATIMPGWSASAGSMTVRSAYSGHTNSVVLLTDTAGQSAGSMSHHAAIELNPVLYRALFFAYMGLFVGLSIRLLWRVQRTRRLAERTKPIVIPQEFESVWQRCRSAFSIGPIDVVSSRDVAGPVTLGFRRVMLVVPPDFFTQWEGEDVAAALGHECAHVRRNDFARNLAYEAMALPIAWHPATWILKGRIAESRELICDEMAADYVAGSADYARSLLRIAGTAYAHPSAATANAVGMFDANILEKRIMNLMEKKQPLSRGMRYGLLLLLAVTVGVACVAANALTATVAQASSDVQKPVAQVEGSKNKVYQVGGEVTAPNLISGADPEYPPEALKARKKIIGTCVLSMVVDETGQPQQVKVTKSLAPAFDKNAVEAVKKWRFTPATLKGHSVPVSISVEVAYKLY